jgi:hypothetical protein
MRQTLAIEQPGQPADSHGLSRKVDHVGKEHMVVRITGPVPGYIVFFTDDKGDGTSGAQIEGYLFSADAPAYVEREQPAWKAWKAWLDGLAVSAT